DRRADRRRGHAAAAGAAGSGAPAAVGADRRRAPAGAARARARHAARHPATGRSRARSAGRDHRAPGGSGRVGKRRRAGRRGDLARGGGGGDGLRSRRARRSPRRAGDRAAADDTEAAAAGGDRDAAGPAGAGGVPRARDDRAGDGRGRAVPAVGRMVARAGEHLSARVLGRSRVGRRRLPRAPGSARRPLVPRWLLRLRAITSSCAADRRSAFSTAPRFFGAARKAGLRPIVGAEISLAGAAPLLLLVEDRRGYQNLCQLITAAKVDSPGKLKSDPLDASTELLAAYAGGLIALAGAAPRADLPALADVFGRDRVFLEVHRHFDADQAHRNRDVLAQAAALNVGVVATNDVRYATPAQRIVHDVLCC